MTPSPLRLSRELRLLLRTTAIALALLASSPLAARAQEGELESMFVTPAEPTVADFVTLHAITLCSNPFAGQPSIQGTTITLDTTYFGLYPPCAANLPPYEVTFPLGTLPAGNYLVQVRGNGGVTDGTVVFRTTFAVRSASDPPPPLQSYRVTVFPEQPTTADPIRIRVSGEQSDGCVPQDLVARVEGSTVALSMTQPIFPCHPLMPYRWSLETTVAAQPEGSYLARLDAFQVLLAAQTFNVTAAPITTLTLDHRFDVRATFGDGQIAHGTSQSEESGSFWFFDPANTELLVKILDGRAINGHFWVFVGSLTDRPFTLTVDDCLNTSELPGSPPCQQHIYSSSEGHDGSIIDLDTF